MIRELLTTVFTCFALLLFAFGATGVVELTVGLPAAIEPLHIGLQDSIWGLSTAGLMFLTLWAFKRR